MDKLSIINGYLRDLGVHPNVMNYMKENRIYLTKYFEDLLGKDFYTWTDEFHKKDFFQKLKNGSDRFRVFDNGSVWYSSTTDPKIETGPAFARHSGFLSTIENQKYDEITINSYISFENGNIVTRDLNTKKQTQNNQTHYDGTMTETIQDIRSKDETRKIAYFFDSPTPLPTKSLEGRIEHRNAYGIMGEMKSTTVDYNMALWSLVASGEIKSQSVLANLNEERISVKGKFRLVKQNLFSKVKARNQSNLFEQLREQSMRLLSNENSDEIIHSEFSIKGNKAEVCTWTLERVTENSRDTIFQMDFQNTEQFRQQMLYPSLIDYAQANSILQGRVNPIDTGLNQYRAFSTTNNVVTVNNISQEEANYISTEIRKVEPVIYNKKMEQNEIELQQANGLGYQKINKKNSGFLNVFLLVFMAGYVSGIILFLIGLILKKSI